MVINLKKISIIIMIVSILIICILFLYMTWFNPLVILGKIMITFIIITYLTFGVYTELINK